MYRFTIENDSVAAHGLAVVSTDELSVLLQPVHAEALTSSSSVPSAAQVPLDVGAVRLLRNIAYKGQFLVPFLPTRHLLVVFPNCVDSSQRGAFASTALDKMSCFLSYLRDASGVDFTVDAVALCQTSGAAVATLSCDTTESTLDVLGAAERVDAQTDRMKMCSVFVRCYPVEVGAPPQFDRAEASADAETSEEVDARRLDTLLRNHYYNIPLCPICADRLELNLTGATEEQPLCACGEVRCHCLRASACTVCQALFHSQLTSINNSNNNNNNNNNNNLSASSNNHNDNTFGSSGTGYSGDALACEACGQTSDPWVCLICGYVGCSRYQAMHAKDHYVSRHHFFSLNVTTQQVWDYESDNFVHRVMMQPEANGDMRRIQYESRENPYASGELDEDLLGDFLVDPGLAKKSVNAKYDLKLTGSHAQYATILKNELDSMRLLLIAQRGDVSTPAPDLTVGPSPSASTNSPPPTADPYEDMSLQVGSILHTYHRQSNQAVSAFLSVQHMQYELARRRAETKHLEQDVAEHDAAVRRAIHANIGVASRLDAEISGQRDLLKDLELNRRVSANLSSRLQPGDGLARVVTVGSASAKAAAKKREKDRPTDSSQKH